MSARKHKVIFHRKGLDRKEDFKQKLLFDRKEKKVDVKKEQHDFKEELTNSKDLIRERIKRNFLAENYEELRLEQNLLKGIAGGIIGGILSALLWVAITVTTERQMGYMAIAVGLIVGYAIRICGKGIDKIFGISGAVIAFLACFIGNFVSIIVFTVNDINEFLPFNISYFEIFQYIDISEFTDKMKESFQRINLLFYGLAIV